MALLERGCFSCCKLETCVKVQAFTLTIGSAVASTVIVVLLAMLTGKEYRKDEQERKFIEGVKTVLVILFVAMTVWVLVGVLMLFGAYKRKRALLAPYMVLATASLFGTLGLMLYLASSVNTHIPSVLVLAMILALQLYMLLHVASLFHQLGLEERQQTRL